MAGGLERNLIWLANMLVSNSYRVTIITFDVKESHSFYAIDDRVIWKKIGISQPHKKISIADKLRTSLEIRKIVTSLHSPILVCYTHGILFRIIFSCIGLKLKVVCSERNALSLYNWVKKTKWNLNFFFLIFVKKITIQFERYREHYPLVLRNRIVEIGNPVYETFNNNLPLERPVELINGKKVILNIGRLCAQKNQIKLINSFYNIASRYHNWNLYLVGNGELKVLLEENIKKLGLFDRVFIINPINNISSWYAFTDIFCLPSQWEGFPNVLAEAMASGVAAIGLSECDGIRDLIDNGVNGILCQEADLEKCMECLINDEDLRIKIGSAARNIVFKYSPDDISRQWLNLIESI